MLRGLIFSIGAIGAVASRASFDVLPPGVSSGINARLGDTQEWTLALHPPEEDRKLVGSMIDSIMKIENENERAMQGDYIAEKQKILNAEISRVRALVANSKKASFLGSSNYGDLRRVADYQINLHEPGESASDIQAEIKAITKVENAKASASAADYIADKQRLLNAALKKVRQIVGAA